MRALLFLPLCHASVVFTSVFLLDSSKFPVNEFSSLVVNLTNATSLTMQSIEPDTITGVEGRRLFVNNSAFYSFQLLHVTRIRALVQVADDQTASAVIRYSLPHEVALRGMGTMGLDGVEIGTDSVHRWFTTTYLELPDFVAQYLILGWAVTVLGFAACVMCYCCCRGSNEVVPTAVVENVLPIHASIKKPTGKNPAAVPIIPAMVRNPSSRR